MNRLFDFIAKYGMGLLAIIFIAACVAVFVLGKGKP